MNPGNPLPIISSSDPDDVHGHVQWQCHSIEMKRAFAGALSARLVLAAGALGPCATNPQCQKHSPPPGGTGALH